MIGRASLIRGSAFEVSSLEIVVAVGMPYSRDRDVKVQASFFAVCRGVVSSMIACVQRVSRAQVTVAGEVCGRIGRGFLVLLGV